MCISGTQAGAFQGEALGSLWDSSPHCWEGLLRVNESPGLGVRPLEQKHDSGVVMKKKAKGRLDFEGNPFSG